MYMADRIVEAAYAFAQIENIVLLEDSRKAIGWSWGPFNRPERSRDCSDADFASNAFYTSLPT